MAQDILNEQNMNERIRIENNWNMDCERARMTAERSDTTPIFPNFPAVPHYDEAEVIAMASRLNEFVSKND
jgi:hypothetical protein